MFRAKLCYAERLDLITSILLLKWLAKASHSATDGLLEVLLLLLFIRRSIVEKRILGLFLLTVIKFAK